MWGRLGLCLLALGCNADPLPAPASASTPGFAYRFAWPRGGTVVLSSRREAGYAHNLQRRDESQTWHIGKSEAPWISMRDYRIRHTSADIHYSYGGKTPDRGRIKVDASGRFVAYGYDGYEAALAKADSAKREDFESLHNYQTMVRESLWQQVAGDWFGIEYHAGKTATVRRRTFLEETRAYVSHDAFFSMRRRSSGRILVARWALTGSDAARFAPANNAHPEATRVEITRQLVLDKAGLLPTEVIENTRIICVDGGGKRVVYPVHESIQLKWKPVLERSS